METSTPQVDGLWPQPSTIQPLVVNGFTTLSYQNSLYLLQGKHHAYYTTIPSQNNGHSERWEIILRGGCWARQTQHNHTLKHHVYDSTVSCYNNFTDLNMTNVLNHTEPIPGGNIMAQMSTLTSYPAWRSSCVQTFQSQYLVHRQLYANGKEFTSNFHLTSFNHLYLCPAWANHR